MFDTRCAVLVMGMAAIINGNALHHISGKHIMGTTWIFDTNKKSILKCLMCSKTSTKDVWYFVHNSIKAISL